MFKFDPSKLSVSFDLLYTVSRATIDPKIGFQSDIKKRVDLPAPCARQMIKNMDKVNKPLFDVPVAIVKYDGRIISASCPKVDHLKDPVKIKDWENSVHRNIDNVKKEVSDKWMFDGRHAYIQVVKNKSLCDKFGIIEYRTFDLFALATSADLRTSGKIGFRCQMNSVVKQTSPLMKSQSRFMVKLNNKTVVDNTNLEPNIRFVCYAARQLSKAGFHYEQLEPLGIPLLMIEHDTFNLEDIPKSIQDVQAAPFHFDQAVFWLVGLIDQSNSLDQYIAVHSCLNMLCKKGHKINFISDESTVDLNKISELKQKMRSEQNIDILAEAS